MGKVKQETETANKYYIYIVLSLVIIPSKGKEKLTMALYMWFSVR